MSFVRTTIVFMFYLLVTGCSSTKNKCQIYLGGDASSRFISGNITILGQYDISKKYDYADVEFLGYRTYSHDFFSGSETFNEDVKQAGLILNAKSFLLYSIDARAVFGNETDSCVLLYKATVEKTRNGRSALTSVTNLVSTFNGEKTQRQHAPDTTAVNYISATGTINFNNRYAPFNYKYNYNNSKYNGWLLLNADTLTIKKIDKLIDEKGAFIKVPHIMRGFELVKDSITYAAFDWNYSGNKQVYILKRLDETEKKIVAAFLFIAASYHSRD